MAKNPNQVADDLLKSLSVLPTQPNDATLVLSELLLKLHHKANSKDIFELMKKLAEVLLSDKVMPDVEEAIKLFSDRAPY